VTIKTLRFALTATLAALILVLAPTALAGKGKPGGGGGGGGGGGTGSSLSLVLLNSTDGLPHYGQTVTFTVSTTATDAPFVSLNCYQGGVWLYSASAGFFPSYPWSQEFILAGAWTGGDADCTAALYTTKDGIRITTLATLNFHVYA